MHFGRASPDDIVEEGTTHDSNDNRRRLEDESVVLTPHLMKLLVLLDCETFIFNLSHGRSLVWNSFRRPDGF